MRKVQAAFALLLAVLPALPSLAADDPTRSPNFKVCMLGQPGDIVTACGALIATGKFAESELAEIYQRRANALRTAKQYDAALQDINRALAILPGSPGLLINRAGVYAATKRYDLALADCNSAIAVTASNPFFLLARGETYFLMKNYDAAIQDFDKAITIQSNDANAYRLRGMVFLKLGLTDRALQDEDEALKIKPDLLAALEIRSEINMRLGRDDAGIQDADTAVRLFPNSTVALNGRCFALAQLNMRLDVARVDCTKALAIAPNTASFLDSLGLVYFRMGDMAKAAAQYDAALAASPQEASSLYMRGVIKLKQGDPSGSADIASAEKLASAVVEMYTRLGIAPQAH